MGVFKGHSADEYTEDCRLLSDMTYEYARKYILANWFDGDDSSKYWDGDEEIMAMKKADEALERLIPKKPIGKHTDYRCSVCGTRVRSGKGSSSRTRDTVCRNCFTVIDWSEDGE